ncbi:MAG: glycosyl hydrolase, partial [Chitinophagaceae bacterium]|nr:glycosyl hydrolase [Chitinophagaceae bacterium]
MKNIFLVCLMFITLGASAQRKKVVSQIASVPSVNPVPDSIFKNLQWRNIGPFRGGRANTITGVIQQEKKFYAGYTGGGVWSTIDGGISWKNISDGYFKVGSIGDIAVSESDPNVLYVGTGEHAVRGVMTSYGDGVYKSVDGGSTWKNIGLEQSRHISEICVHPTNPDIVYVGAQGTVHGPNNERGVFKSTDGGAHWKKVLYINDSTGIASLSMDMNNPRILYAAAWEHRRFPWTVSSGGKGSSLWKSVDEGETWTKLTEGLPTNLGKIGVSVSRVNSNRVYAIVESEKKKSGLYRSDDGGKSWALLSNNQDISSRSWYYMKVYADTKNENIVYVLNAPMMRSIDGGKTFTNVKVGHGDTHDLWINPRNNNLIGLADDGGGEISFDQAKTWSSIMNQPTAQFYRVNTDNVFPYKVYGGQQDNSSVIIASRNNTGAITERDWNNGAGCESAYLSFDPNDPLLVYGGCYQGYIEVLNTKTNEAKDIQAYPSLNLAIQPKEMKYRFNWNAPIVTSTHNPKIIYHAGNVLLKTSNGGFNWEVISPDLTRNDKSKQGPGGIPFTNEGAGGENYNTIFYVKESPLDANTIYTGSDCGLVYVTNDAGKNWQNITPADLQESQINSIEVSRFDQGVVYISATRYKFNDYASYTYKTIDNGKTWTKINNGIKNDDFIKVIREDNKNKNILYAGSERGFYISNDAGTTWQPFQLNLPIVPVTDLMIRDNDLVAATA